MIEERVPATDGQVEYTQVEHASGINGQKRRCSAWVALLVIFSSLFFSTAVLGAKNKVKDPTKDVDILALNRKMAEFMVKHINPRLDDEGKLQSLLDVIFDRKRLNIVYGNSQTFTAIETFEARSGNCLSFTILFVALARHIGLAAYFQEVEEVTSWDRRGELVITHRHMFAEVEINNGLVQIDFLPGAEKRYRLVRRIDRERALAHYYNNLGVEQLTTGKLETARIYFEKALATDASFAPAATNLGVNFRRQKEFDLAEASYLRALKIDPTDMTAASNLSSLLLLQGRQKEADPYLLKAKEHLQRNPFYHFRLGLNAQQQGNYADAIQHFKQAVRRQDDDPEIHAALAEAYGQSGDQAKATLSLQKALKLTQDPAEKNKLLQRLENDSPEAPAAPER